MTAISKENEPDEDVRQSTTGQSRQTRKGTGLRNYPRKVAPGVKAMQAAADSRYFTELRQHFDEVPLSHKCCLQLICTDRISDAILLRINCFVAPI